MTTVPCQAFYAVELGDGSFVRCKYQYQMYWLDWHSDEQCFLILYARFLGNI